MTNNCTIVKITFRGMYAAVAPLLVMQLTRDVVPGEHALSPYNCARITQART